ncbi:Protein N-acetyltransferase, RimJ/RimL family [Actinacidiphila alni]|uniref:Protein N-acetyltransferase, RimJ/RimL family n=1 Tax=Actinacidiphila alni TaxID=380248 RepID=A0A1I2B243_9ACTN|nr:GNAT family N-acetyltransferase [Actinacidiphila alni]SFE49978.1 Protein N-acetyltransferase, RimJ/RimL family [Actinacidiphila alni]
MTSTLRGLLDDVARGTFPPADGTVTFVPQPSARDAGVIAFTAHTVVFADPADTPGDGGGADGRTPDAGLRALLPPGDLSAPLNPPFLAALCARTGRAVNNIDLLALAEPLPGPPPLALTETTDRLHPRLVRALRHRDDVRAWTVPGGTVLIGRGVAGRWEAAVEVDPGARGRGLGRGLARAARHLVPDGEPLWAQIAPGNAASVRALLSAGFVPVGAEALLVRHEAC